MKMQGKKTLKETQTTFLVIRYNVPEALDAFVRVQPEASEPIMQINVIGAMEQLITRTH